MKVFTSIEDASASMKTLAELTKERDAIVRRFNQAILKKRPITQKEIELELIEINAKIKPLKESVMYIELKTWIDVAKTYLTKQNVDEINKRVVEIVMNPKLLQ